MYTFYRNKSGTCLGTSIETLQAVLRDLRNCDLLCVHGGSLHSRFPELEQLLRKLLRGWKQLGFFQGIQFRAGVCVVYAMSENTHNSII